MGIGYASAGALFIGGATAMALARREFDRWKDDRNRRRTLERMAIARAVAAAVRAQVEMEFAARFEFAEEQAGRMPFTFPDAEK